MCRRMYRRARYAGFYCGMEFWDLDGHACSRQWGLADIRVSRNACAVIIVVPSSLVTGNGPCSRLAVHEVP